MSHDIRYALRLLLKSPAFSIVAAVTLALGIGANTAIFSVIRHVLLNTLPYRDADRIVTIWLADPDHGFPKDNMSYPRFEETRALKNALSDTAAFDDTTAVLSGVDEPRQLRGVQVSAEFFRVLGVSPKLGRGFQAHEDQPGRDHCSHPQPRSVDSPIRRESDSARPEDTAELAAL